MTVPGIARCLCCPVCGREVALEPPRRGQWTPRHRLFAVRLVGGGMTVKGIARMFGVDRNTVRSQLDRMNHRGAA